MNVHECPLSRLLSRPFLPRTRWARSSNTQVLALRGVLRGAVGGYRTLVGTNVAALRYLTKVRCIAHTYLHT